MFLYYAVSRDNQREFSMCSFETICEKTDVIEKRIPRSNSFLVSCQLLANVTRAHSGISQKMEANKYYLWGYKDLFAGFKAPVPH